MKIAADFSQRVVVHSASMPWVTSPIAGVDRRPLDRVGAEVARATTVVRFAPGSQFSAHLHGGGEEFLVLEGVFQDEMGDYPVGSYVRNPPQSKHTPSSVQGCVILVKLWQFQPSDRTHVKLQINAMGHVALSEKGVSKTPLYQDEYEEVYLLHFASNATFALANSAGVEVFVLEGELDEESDKLVKHSWLRAPTSQSLVLKAGIAGAKVWLKTGHLADVEQQILRVG